MDTPNFYKQVATTTRSRLGPTAERFVARQIREHTQKDLKTLEPKDLRPLINWIELAMRTIYSDQRNIEIYLHDLRALTSPKTKNSSAHGKEI